MMRYGYFDSEITGIDAEGMPIFDRAETSELFRLLFAKLLTNGVLAKPSDCFQVLAGENGLTVKVRPGFGMINGAFAYDAVESTYALEAAPAQNSRIDRMVLRCNYLERLCEIVVKTGTAATNPVPPALLQPVSGDYYELGLALVTVGANKTMLTQSAITDTRADSSVCGFVTQFIDSIDTEVFFAQFNAFYREFTEKSNASYAEFERMAQAAYNGYTTAIDSYIAALEEQGNASLTKITEDLKEFQEKSQNEITTWFEGVQGLLEGDVAVKLASDVEVLKSGKQDKISGVQGQIVGFDENGEPAAQAPPDTINGSMTIRGDLTLRGDSNYGTKINLGDGDYVHISEPIDDCLEIKAKKVNFVISSTDADSVAINGKPLAGKSLAGMRVQPENGKTVTAGTGAEIFNDYRNRTFSSSSRNVNQGNVASGSYSYAEGQNTTASGYNSHAEGYGTLAYASAAHAEGQDCIASARSSHAGGKASIAAIAASVLKVKTQDKQLKYFEVYSPEITLDNGDKTTAFADLKLGSTIMSVSYFSTSNVIAYYTVIAKGTDTNRVYVEEDMPSCFTPSILINLDTSTDAQNNVGIQAMGYGVVAAGKGAYAEGVGTIAVGAGAHAEGAYTEALDNYAHAGGYRTIAHYKQTVIGSANVEYKLSSGTGSGKLIVGKGISETARANCLRVTDTGGYASGSYSSSGADYAEFFEWLDGNPEQEDRAGLFVTLEGEKIRLARPDDDFILGIVSGEPSVCGDVYDDQWKGMYLYDIYGRPLWEDVEVPDETIEEPSPENPDETITRVMIPAHMEHRQKLNPDYDNTQPYAPRSERPEWDAVGMLGKLVVRDDGTCRADGWCTVGESGTATYSDTRTKYRVMARLDESHIRVLIL